MKQLTEKEKEDLSEAREMIENGASMHAILMHYIAKNPFSDIANEYDTASKRLIAEHDESQESVDPRRG